MLELSTVIKEKITHKVLTLAQCIKIELRDGTKIGFTTHTRDVCFIEEPDLIYSCIGFTPAVVSKNNNMAVDNSEGQMIIDNELVKKDDLEKGKYNNAEYFLLEFDWSLKDYDGYYSKSDIIKEINGNIGEVKRSKMQFSCEYRSLSQYLAITIIDTYKSTCPATLGDSRCKVNLSSYTFEDSISAVIRNNQFIISDSTKDTGYFNNGQIEFISGENEGKKYTIKSWDKDTKILSLQMNVNYPVADGDLIKLIKGCNKTKANCQEFANYVNFQGFYEIPGLDFIMSGGGTKVNY